MHAHNEMISYSYWLKWPYATLVSSVTSSLLVAVNTTSSYTGATGVGGRGLYRALPQQQPIRVPKPSPPSRPTINSNAPSEAVKVTEKKLKI